MGEVGLAAHTSDFTLVSDEHVVGFVQRYDAVFDFTSSRLATRQACDVAKRCTSCWIVLTAHGACWIECHGLLCVNACGGATSCCERKKPPKPELGRLRYCFSFLKESYNESNKRYCTTAEGETTLGLMLDRSPAAVSNGTSGDCLMATVAGSTSYLASTLPTSN